MLALVLAGCGGSLDTVSNSGTDVYVPSAATVVRAADDGAARVPLQASESLALVLAESQGTVNQFEVAAMEDGSLFAIDVYDGGLRGFDKDGAPLLWTEISEHVLRFDRAPLGIAVQGANLLLSYAFPGQLLTVSLSGAVTSDVATTTSPWQPFGLGDGTFVAVEVETAVVGRYDADFRELARYTVFSFPDEEWGGDARLWPHPDFVVGRERVYVTTAEEHKVAAFDIGGTAAWALEGDRDRISIPENVSGKTLGRSRRAGRAAGGTIDTEYANVKWPEYYPALARIATDPLDRLYVFPYVVESAPDRYPVDIYDADGGLIVSGWLPFQGWDAFAGDSVYRIEVRDGLKAVVRYQLEVPSEGAGPASAQ